ncbi:uncharacterized protein MJAP1_001453 [Malassezia japonica]|uniref:Uncharacterized protein n=1 Tax=Malassezia japonica TaxID=223818 RepID=A0AAF0EX36_9BASI|nr:uncharacterized protein MJAP1_001453 [Malassezia japonica]WFD38500.1 hypothetical protein MJAP1_001453 [Malassezia japonica]
MAQGFKPLKRNLGVAQKEKRKGNSNAGPKVGKRIAPKKKGALQEVIQKKRDTALSTSRIEREMAGRAQKGPLSIMRSVADQADKGAKPKPKP